MIKDFVLLFIKFIVYYCSLENSEFYFDLLIKSLIFDNNLTYCFQCLTLDVFRHCKRFVLGLQKKCNCKGFQVL